LTLPTQNDVASSTYGPRPIYTLSQNHASTSAKSKTCIIFLWKQ